MNSDTQRLYDAIMTLGRSAEDAEQGGWICGVLQEGHWNTGPKCVNGLITWNLTKYNDDELQLITYITDTDLPFHQREAAVLAGRALLKTAPPGMLSVQTVSTIDTISDGAVENILIEINDTEDNEEPVLNPQTAAEWFWRAFDLLAEQLPDPNMLTVDEIVGAPRIESLDISEEARVFVELHKRP